MYIYTYMYTNIFICIIVNGRGGANVMNTSFDYVVFMRDEKEAAEGIAKAMCHNKCF